MIKDTKIHSSPSTYTDTQVQTTSPERSYRDVVKLHKIIQTKGLNTTDEGVQTTSSDSLDNTFVSENIKPSTEEKPSDKYVTSEKYQQTTVSKTPTASAYSQTSPLSSLTEKEIHEPREEGTRPKKINVEKKFENEFIDQEKIQGESYMGEPFNVSVTTKVSVNRPSDSTTEKANLFIDHEKSIDNSGGQLPKDRKEKDKKTKKSFEKVEKMEEPKSKEDPTLLNQASAITPDDDDTIRKIMKTDDKVDSTDSDRKLFVDKFIDSEKESNQKDKNKKKPLVDVKVKKSGDSPAEKGLDDKKKGDDTIDFIKSEKFKNPDLEDQKGVYISNVSKIGKERFKKIKDLKNRTRGLNWYPDTSESVDPLKSLKDDIQQLEDAIARNENEEIQIVLIYFIKNINYWLETIENRILQSRFDTTEGPNRDKLNDAKSVKEEIIFLRTSVDNLLKKINKMPNVTESDNNIYWVKIYLEEIEPQITSIKEVTETEGKKVADELSRWEEFLNSVNNLSVIVEESKQNFESLLDSDETTNAKLKEFEKIEKANKENIENAEKLLNQAKDWAKDYQNLEIPLEVYTTYETAKNIENNLNAEKERLLQLLSLADEYEQTLKEFAQIIEVADNLVESPITITSLNHLQEEMQKHRKFFVNLSHCRAILESLESNLDEETKGAHNELHSKLHSKASTILDKAASRAQQMAMAASKWTILDKGVRKEQQWLQVVHQRMPDLQQVISSDYDQYISLYQSLASDTANHHSKILQLIDVANKLQDVITCVGLEKFYDDYLNIIVTLQEEISNNLEKLLAFQVSVLLIKNKLFVLFFF